MKNLFNSIIHINIDKSNEDNQTILVAVISILLLQVGIIFDLFKNKSSSLIKYLLLSFFIIIVSIAMLLSTKLYEFFIYRNAEYILYITKEGDNLISISRQYLPECNPLKTCKIIKNKNGIIGDISPGTRILIPVKK